MGSKDITANLEEMIVGALLRAKLKINDQDLDNKDVDEENASKICESIPNLNASTATTHEQHASPPEDKPSVSARRTAPRSL